MSFEFKYENVIPALEPGDYIVDITYPGSSKKRQCASWLGSDWEQLGLDYDIWQYHNPRPKIEVIARIDARKLMIIEVTE